MHAERSTEPTRASPAVLAIVLLLVVSGLFITVGTLMLLRNQAIGMWAAQLGIFLGVPWAALRLSGADPVRYSGLSLPGTRQCLIGFALGATNFFAVIIPLQLAAQALLPKELRERFDQSRIFEGHSALELSLIIAAVSVAAPLCEEFFFRGVFQRGLMPPVFPKSRGLLLAAAVFAAFHFNPVAFPGLLELGLLFGALYLWSGSIWPSVLAHSANNVVSTALYFAFRHEPTEDVTSQELWGVALVAAIGFAAMAALVSYARTLPPSSAAREVKPSEPEARP